MTLSQYQTPLPHFETWLSLARQSEPSDPDAACLATVDTQGFPNARVVLVRHIDSRGFCFFTNTHSQKGQEILHCAKAALNFHWKTRKQQVRIRGTVTMVAPEEADSYYQSRPLGNKIGAWASEQSQPLTHRDILIARVREAEERYGDTPPRPPHWSGFRVIPFSIEFWQEGEARLHHRTRYDLENGMWVTSTLYP